MHIKTKQTILGATLVVTALLLGACTNDADVYVPVPETPAAEQTIEVVEPDVTEPEPEEEDVVETLDAEEVDVDAEPELGSWIPGVIRIRPLESAAEVTEPGNAQILEADPGRGQGWVKFDTDHNLVFFSENPTTIGWIQPRTEYSLTFIVLWGPEAGDMPGAQEAFDELKSNYWVIELEDPASVHDVEVWGQSFGAHTTFSDIGVG